MMTDITLLRTPVPFTRTGASRTGGRYTPARYRAWKDYFGWEARAAHDGDPWTCDVIALVNVAPDGVRARFLSGDHPPGIGFDFGPGRPTGVRGDLDNYVKAVLDASNGIVFDDDRRVTVIIAGFTDTVEVV